MHMLLLLYAILPVNTPIDALLRPGESLKIAAVEDLWL